MTLLSSTLKQRTVISYTVSSHTEINADDSEILDVLHVQPVFPLVKSSWYTNETVGAAHQAALMGSNLTVTTSSSLAAHYCPFSCTGIITSNSMQ